LPTRTMSEVFDWNGEAMSLTVSHRIRFHSGWL